MSASETTLAGSWYELLARIGSGGMATIYVGRWRGAPRGAPLVAIKRMHAHLLRDRGAREAMLTEGNIGARLRHPNMVSVHDVEDLGSELLLAMDYVEGASLHDLLSMAPLLPRPVGVRIILDVAAGLAALHALVGESGEPLDAVHRDVAPDNILVGLDGTTRLTDFGVVKAAGLGGEHTTQEGVVKGKYAYMAPEYLMGYAADARADVFSLAVVAFEVLAGKHPFRAATAASTIHRVARMEAPRLSSVATGLGGEFDAVIGRALAKNPALRFGSVAAFAHELSASAAWSGIAAPAHVSATVRDLAGDALANRRAHIDDELAALESSGVHPRRQGASPPDTRQHSDFDERW